MEFRLRLSIRRFLFLFVIFQFANELFFAQLTEKTHQRIARARTKRENASTVLKFRLQMTVELRRMK